MSNITRAIITFFGIGICSATACAHGPTAADDDLKLSDDLRSLLQDEMREIAGASQALVLAIASGDWDSMIETSEKISASYVMAKSLTDEQKHELGEKLPDRFKRLDKEFHARAVRLAMAAAARDAETVAFQYSRLIESCATCHAEYAKSRFPGFSPKTTASDHHH